MNYLDIKQIELKGSYDGICGAMQTLLEEMKQSLSKINIHGGREILEELEKVKTKMGFFPIYLERKQELYELMRKQKMVD